MVAAVAGGGVYAALCALVYARQEDLVYPAPSVRTRPTGRALTVEVPSGTFLLWREAAPAGPVVVHFHGNGEQVGDLGWLAESYAARGISFAAVEYPGYAGAGGTAGEAAILEAARAALRHLTGPLGVSPGRVVLSGHSLGTGAAVALAEEGWGVQVLLLSPYTSLPDVGARAFPWLPVRLLMRDRFDSASRAPRVAVPVLVLHGTLDEVIPFDLGHLLAARFPRCRFVPVPGAHHNDLWEAPPTMSEVLAFLGRGS
jgi:alpha-beta hydrolase superfamily lysophospholipase